MREAGEGNGREDGPGEVLGLMREMWSVDHGLQRLSKRMASGIGVTGPQRLVLRHLGREPELSPARLAAALHLHASTVTGIVQRLERAGYVRRRPDPGDGRRSLLDLTAAGRRVEAPIAGTIEAAMEAAVRSVPRGTVASARRLLVAVAGELERALSVPGPAGSRRAARCEEDRVLRRGERAEGPRGRQVVGMVPPIGSVGRLTVRRTSVLERARRTGAGLRRILS